MSTVAKELPASAEELRRLFEEKARGLAADSPEFGDVLRLVVPEFRVHLVRLTHAVLPRRRGGALRPRSSRSIPSAVHPATPVGTATCRCSRTGATAAG